MQIKFVKLCTHVQFYWITYKFYLNTKLPHALLQLLWACLHNLVLYYSCRVFFFFFFFLCFCVFFFFYCFELMYNFAVFCKIIHKMTFNNFIQLTLLARLSSRTTCLLVMPCLSLCFVSPIFSFVTLSNCMGFPLILELLALLSIAWCLGLALDESWKWK